MPENLRRGTVPAWVYALAVLGLIALALPLLGLGARVPWSSIPAIMGEGDARTALWLSLKTCLISTVFAVVLGIPTAVLLSSRWRGVKVARVLVLLPMALPPVVAGLALLQTFGRRGLIGSLLAPLGIQIGFTTTAVIMAQTFVSMPFLIVALQGALQVREGGHEQVAATLGARPTRILTRVTLPLVAPAIAQGTALALARSLGEFGATLTFAGSLTGVTRTMPLEIYLQRETDPQIALALAAVLIGVAVLVVAVTAWQQQGGVRTAEPAEDEGAARTPEPAPDGAHGAAIAAHITVPERDVDIELDVGAGRVLALLGRNGSGKSTAVQVMAGLLPGPGSTFAIGDRQIDGRGVTVATRDRGIALLAQRPLLLPHLSAADNVAFGLRSRGVSSAAARTRALAELGAVGCAHLAERRPHQLSGGQAARVSLARALATEPQVIFLDEPMAALDVDAAADVRALLARRFAASHPTVVLVTHNLLDVAALATDVVVLDRGRIVESGPARDILTRPRTEFTAALAGMNMVLGAAAAHAEDPHLATVTAGPLAITGVLEAGAGGAPTPGREAVALFAPSAVALYAPEDRPSGSPRNVLRVQVLGVEQAGGLARVALRPATDGTGGTAHPPVVLHADVTLGSVRDLEIAPGRHLIAAIKAAEVDVAGRP